MPKRALAIDSVTERGVHIAFLTLALIMGVSILTLPPYAPFLLLGSILLFVLITEKPELGLLLIAFATPLINARIAFGRYLSRYVIHERNNFLIVEILLVIVLVGVAIGRVTGKVEPFKRQNVDLPIIFLIAYSTITLVWAKELTPGILILLHLLSCILLFYLPIILLRSMRVLRAILWIWLLLGVFAAVIALLTLYIQFRPLSLLSYKIYPGNTVIHFHFTIFENIRQRVGGLGDPNRMAYLLNTVLMAALALLLTTKKYYLKGLISLLMLFILYTDNHTLSKGGLGSLIITFIMYLVVHPRFKERHLKTLAIFMIAFLTVLISMSVMELKGGFGRLGVSPIETRGGTSLALRFKWWGKDFEELFLTDGLGTGIGGISDEVWAYAQSTSFSILAELGLIGFFLALWLFFAYATELYSVMRAIKGDNFYFTAALSFVGSVVIFLIHSVVDFSYILRIPWLMAGLAMATAKMGYRSLIRESITDRQ